MTTRKRGATLSAAQVVAAFNRSTYGEAGVPDLVERVDPNGVDRWGQRPLVMAVEFSEVATVKRLLERGADVTQGRLWLTPLTRAARRGDARLVACLRAAGARPSLLTAVYLGEQAIVKAALAKDAGLASQRDEDDTPFLHHAARSLHLAMVQLLLARGASVDERDGNSQTALHVVADMRRAPQKEAAAMARLLLKKGADPDARNWSEVTPLHQAVRARNLSVVRVLLDAGADPNARDRRGSTPLRRAIAGTGAAATAGATALMAPLAQILLDHGADPGARDDRGVPVIASARSAELRALLESHTASAKRSAGSPRKKTAKDAGRRSTPPQRTPKGTKRRGKRRTQKRRVSERSA